ncbi:DNA repair helicase XPB [Thermoleptolyngbya sp. C42_A2020_037]|uniref:DNA repair helicase XPB n=1 Tax=Thermoleptolyngbya sp. C42_A2020_037 TaxID=2747799 RepID=UPI001A0BF2F2|nr:DNA repair helicase XPB [Thermoleptolyngbya sp. C42_A2020_037]MBF2083496.1 DEAD/DEAH box helicase [Thermoleptolyngbya sp. C42_A2020_037]
MVYVADNALIIQSDRSVLLEVHSPRAEAAREAIAPFAELVKSPEHIHTYQISPLSIWNARAAGMHVADMIAALREHAKYPMPDAVAQEIEALGSRYGLTVIEREGDCLLLKMADQPLAELLSRNESVAKFLGDRRSALVFEVNAGDRGVLKQALLGAGYPAEDLAGYVEGDALSIELRSVSQSGQPFSLRDYQKEAAEVFYQAGSVRGGSGVIVLPCGAGKTMVGMAAIAAVQENTLVLTSSLTSVRQWRRELLDKTTLPPEAIAEYSGETKQTGPITLATYQILSYHDHKTGDFPHFQLFSARSWGLIIYDEVHLLPAPIFRITAELQARRRLGLTATLIREDGKEGDVFALIGPKRYDVPWRELEGRGFIAAAECTEIRVPQDLDRQMEYALAEKRQQFRIAAENPRKAEVVMSLLQQQAEHRILIIGEYLDQLKHLAELTNLPIVTGKTSQRDRDQLYEQFRAGKVAGLILSRVGNFALDLPDADVLIQVSGKYGSRQEEAQRLGRVLRPKADGRSAQFFTLVSLRTCEEDFARHRQLFLAEQGYSYHIQVLDS